MDALLKTATETEGPDHARPRWNASGVFIHHLRNSVGCLAGLLDMLRIKQEDKTFREQFLRLSQEAIDAGLALLDEFSELNQPLELKREAIDPEPWIRDLVASHSVSQSPKIKVLWQLNKANLEPLYGDPAHLSRAINALLQNAVEAMPQGGTLTIEACSDADKRCDRLVFRDTGIGMDDYVVEQATVPFFSMKNNQRGMGLSWAQKIIMAHGGSLDIESAPKQGTSIVITFPSSLSAKK